MVRRASWHRRIGRRPRFPLRWLRTCHPARRPCSRDRGLPGALSGRRFRRRWRSAASLTSCAVADRPLHKSLSAKPHIHRGFPLAADLGHRRTSSSRSIRSPSRRRRVGGRSSVGYSARRRKPYFATAQVPMVANIATAIPEGIVVPLPSLLWETRSGPHTEATATAIHIAAIASDAHVSATSRADQPRGSTPCRRV